MPLEEPQWGVRTDVSMIHNPSGLDFLDLYQTAGIVRGILLPDPALVVWNGCLAAHATILTRQPDLNRGLRVRWLENGVFEVDFQEGKPGFPIGLSRKQVEHWVLNLTPIRQIMPIRDWAIKIDHPVTA